MGGGGGRQGWVVSLAKKTKFSENFCVPSVRKKGAQTFHWHGSLGEGEDSRKNFACCLLEFPKSLQNFQKEEKRKLNFSHGRVFLVLRTELSFNFQKVLSQIVMFKKPPCDHV